MNKKTLMLVALGVFGALQIFGALRATEMRTLPMAASTAIILGTARMGTDARTSVVDSESRSHDHKNLFIVGGANFPTSGVLPPP